MNAIKVGYARVSTDEQDVTAQRNALLALGVDEDRIYVDRGMTGTNRERPGLRLALAAVRAGDTLVVTKLDRLARSLADVRDIADELTRAGVALSFNGSTYDPADPVSRLMFHILGIIAEFESDLIRMRTREGMELARARGRLRGKPPKLTALQRELLFSLYDTEKHTQRELADLLGVSRSTISRELQRRRAGQARPTTDRMARRPSQPPPP